MMIFVEIEVIILTFNAASKEKHFFVDIVAITALSYFIIILYFLRKRFRNERLRGENLRLNTAKSSLPQYVQETVNLTTHAESPDNLELDQ